MANAPTIAAFFRACTPLAHSETFWNDRNRKPRVILSDGNERHGIRRVRRLAFALTATTLWNNIVITMKALHITIRQIGNSQGVVIPKPVLAQVGLVADAELTVERGAIVLRKPSKSSRSGWAKAAKAVAARGGDELVLGEFGNEGDSELVW